MENTTQHQLPLNRSIVAILKKRIRKKITTGTKAAEKRIKKYLPVRSEDHEIKWAKIQMMYNGYGQIKSNQIQTMQPSHSLKSPKLKPTNS